MDLFIYLLTNKMAVIFRFGIEDIFTDHPTKLFCTSLTIGEVNWKVIFLLRILEIYYFKSAWWSSRQLLERVFCILLLNKRYQHMFIYMFTSTSTSAASWHLLVCISEITEKDKNRYYKLFFNNQDIFQCCGFLFEVFK